jgi:hypothetical protein
MRLAGIRETSRKNNFLPASQIRARWVPDNLRIATNRHFSVWVVAALVAETCYRPSFTQQRGILRFYGWDESDDG